jgi:hypothetical protein
MRRKWIAGVVALAAIGSTAAVATSVFGSGAEPPSRPDYATVAVDLGGSQPALARRGSKPKVRYLRSPTPAQINPADPAVGGVGPYIDVKLTGCAKVIDGGVFPSSTDVNVQGSYVQSAREYHVLIGLDDQALSTRAPFTITSNLTCLKGVK